MGPIPMSTLLGLSMTTLATMIAYTSAIPLVQTPPQTPSPSEMIGLSFSIILAFVGLAVHIGNLSSEAVFRSLAYGFMGANLGFGWLFFGVAGEKRYDYGVVALVPAFAGLLGGVWLHDGDVRYLEPPGTADQLTFGKRAGAVMNEKKTS